MSAAIESGMAKSMIEEAAAKKQVRRPWHTRAGCTSRCAETHASCAWSLDSFAAQARVDSGADVVVGTNKYVMENQEPVDVLSISNERVRVSQLAKLKVRNACHARYDGWNSADRLRLRRFR